MKKYEKPTLEVVNLSVKENLAADPKTWEDGEIFYTQYNLNGGGS